MDAQLKKGLLDNCVLCVLEKGDSYGYRIIADLYGVLEVSESTLYPILRRQEIAGLLDVYEKPFNGRLRKYYSITVKGKQQLEIAKKEIIGMKRIISWILKEEGKNGSEE